MTSLPTARCRRPCRPGAGAGTTVPPAFGALVSRYITNDIAAERVEAAGMLSRIGRCRAGGQGADTSARDAPPALRLTNSSIGIQ